MSVSGQRSISHVIAPSLKRWVTDANKAVCNLNSLVAAVTAVAYIPGYIVCMISKSMACWHITTASPPSSQRIPALCSIVYHLRLRPHEKTLIYYSAYLLRLSQRQGQRRRRLAGPRRGRILSPQYFKRVSCPQRLSQYIQGPTVRAGSANDI